MYMLKRGVSIVMTAQIENILSVVCRVYKAFRLPVVITSGTDGPHRSDSLHYKFLAIDIRQNFDNQELNDIWHLHNANIVSHLREEFRKLKYPVDVVPEGDHVHIEWDERGRK